MWYLAHQQAREIIAAREREADLRRIEAAAREGREVEQAARRGRNADPDRRARLTGPAAARRWAARRALAASRVTARLALLLDPGTVPDGSSPAR